MQNDQTPEKQHNLLTHKRCKNHHGREAVARCPSCTSYYCLECIAEHEHRMLCTQCLKVALEEQKESSLPVKAVLSFLQLIIGFILVWIVFYYLGQALLLIPESFHDGTFWERMM